MRGPALLCLAILATLNCNTDALPPTAIQSTLDNLLQTMGTANASYPSNVLIVYAADGADDIEQLAQTIGDGASSVGAQVRVVEVSVVNYKRDVYEWAHAVVLGSGVFNGNPSPKILQFVNSFDFEDRLTNKVAGAFATGGAAAGGLEQVLASINRALKTFGLVSIGGSNWKNADGTGIITDPSQVCTNDTWLARDQGIRTAQMAYNLNIPQGGLAPPNPGVTMVLNSVADSMGKARFSDETKLKCTCESYCRGWTAAIGCGICLPSAFSIPPEADGDRMCVHPGPLGNGLLCRVDQNTMKMTGESCCGVGGPCELPNASDPNLVKDGLWPGACCADSGNTGHGNCGNCAGGSPLSDRFPLLNDTRTYAAIRRYYDYKTGSCMTGDAPVNMN